MSSCGRSSFLIPFWILIGSALILRVVVELEMIRRLLIAVGFIVFGAGLSHAAPTLSDYAARPEFRALDLSPDGEAVSFVRVVGGDEFLCVYDIENRSQKCYANLGDLRADRTRFLSEKTILLVATERTRVFSYRGRFDQSTPFVANIETGEVDLLFRRATELHPAQAGLGRIIGVDPDVEHVYMPAYNNTNKPEYDVFSVSVDDGRGRRILRGTRDTTDWIVDAEGEAVARENYDDDDSEYSVDVPDGNGWRQIFQREQHLRSIYLNGITPDGGHLVFVNTIDDETADGVYYMSRENGAISGPFYVQPGHDIDAVILDDNLVFEGVQYSGITPSYFFLDETLNDTLDAIVAQLPEVNVEYVGRSDDGARIVLRLSGLNYAGDYIVYDIPSRSVVLSLPQRRWIAAEDLAQSAAIEYPSRDGLKISAVVTWPAGTDVTNPPVLPTIVLPHGGPQVYDQLGYNYLPQALANQGYMVLQPNFRGSSGHGWAFTRAGHGEWGRAMQDDITDGVNLLVDEGWIDPERVCIVGWSYGGYAALAGGAFTPDLYKCVVSIAGVADLRDMLTHVSHGPGYDSQSYRVWVERFGQDGTDRTDLAPISPYEHAEAFRAPVLLLHGGDDFIVPDRQSRRMEDALKDAGADVRMRIFRGQNHSIMEEDAREEVLQEIVDFVNEHIGD